MSAAGSLDAIITGYMEQIEHQLSVAAEALAKATSEQNALTR
jgi:hypothetical protein